MEYHALLKSLHLLGVVIFLGNIIVTAVWKALADHTKEPAVIGYAQRLVNVTDIFFTALGALLIYTTGQLLTPAFGSVMNTPWITLGLSLFIASGIIWVFILIPVQIMQSRLTRGLTPGCDIPAGYWRLSRTWMAFGILATLLPLINLYVMVFKPI